MNLQQRRVLSEGEVSRYHEDGLLIPKYRLPADVLADIQRLLGELIARNPEVPQELLLNCNVEDGSLGGVRGDRAFLRFAAYPPLLDILEQVLGPDIILWDVAVICKPPKVGKGIPWHQDSPYFVKIRPIDTATIWIAIDGAWPDNGCMKFIPGLHKKGILNHIRVDDVDPDVLLGFETSVDPAVLEEEKARPVILEPGEFCVFSAHCPHSSTPNTSGRRRGALILRYMSGSSVYDDTKVGLLDSKGEPVDPIGRPIYLMRGQDRTGRNVLTELPPAARA